MTDFETFCADLKARIDTAYNDLGYEIGWRLLASPKATLQTADTALIGLNPGGDRIPDDHPYFCMPPGKNSFRDEQWGTHEFGQAPLQKQVQSLFKKLNRRPEDVLCGEFIPFRSPEINALPNRKIAEEFARALWRDIFDITHPKLVMTLGKNVFYALHGVLGGSEIEEISINWGNVKARRTQCRDCVLVGVPHLSHFGFINRKESAQPLSKMFKEFLV